MPIAQVRHEPLHFTPPFFMNNGSFYMYPQFYNSIIFSSKNGHVFVINWQIFNYPPHWYDIATLIIYLDKV
jgi:hypothetical protein